MLKMNGRARPAPISEDPVIQALSCQPVGAIFNDTELYGELQTIKNHVRTLKHPVGFWDIAIYVYALGVIYGKREERQKKKGVIHKSR